MKVVPDMLPELHPSLDLRIRYLEPPPKSNYLRTRVKRKLRQVEPGSFLVPEQVRFQDRLSSLLVEPFGVMRRRFRYPCK